MPHVNGGGGDDLASSDEVKVYKEEDKELESRAEEVLDDDKSDLVASGEDKNSPLQASHSYVTPKDAVPLRSQLSPVVGKSELIPHERPLNMGYIVTPYPYANGPAGHIPVSMASKVSLPPTHPGSPLSFVMYPNETFGQPPPAHMGIPPVHLDPKTGIPRPPMYTLPSPGQYPHPMFTPEFAQWHAPGMYPITTATGYRGPYPTSLVTTASGLPRFPPAGLIPAHPGLPPPHPGLPHPAIVTPGPKQEVAASSVAPQENHLSYYFLPPLSSANGMLYNPSFHGNQLPSNPSTPSPDLVYQLTLDLRNFKHAQQNQDGRHSSVVDPKSLSSSSNESKNNSDSSNHHHHHHQHHHNNNNNNNNNESNKKNKMSHIKKPLNAFMLYMKEMRAAVVAECTLKESAAINQILGRKWHALGRDDQAKYYELARKERQLHMQLYPGWSARDNYAQQGKKKKRKRDKSVDGEGSNPKKCRARFGLDQQSSWCKPCRRKKKCIRYVDGSDGASVDIDDNLGSVGSSGDLGTPDSKSLMDSDQDPHTSSEISLSSPPVPTDVIVDQHHHKPNSLCVINPHDANHPLSISSLTGQCLSTSVKREPGPSLTEPASSKSTGANSISNSNSTDSVTATAPHTIVSVT